MGWFSGQSKAAKELERKRQQERDEENAKKADDVCEEQKTPYQKKVDKPPNVLRVTIIRAKDLPAVDKKLFGKGPASADPFPCMSVEGNDCKGSVKKKCLAPVWLERFELPCEDPDSVFSFEVMDHDNFGAADFMGGCLCGNQVQASFECIRGTSCPSLSRGAEIARRDRSHSVRSGNASRRWRGGLDDALGRHRRKT